MQLPVLNSMIRSIQADIPDLRGVVFVCVQHLLHTSIDIFQGILRLGADPRNIFLLGKQYSNCPSVIDKAHSLGIQIQKSTPLEELGEYESVFNADITKMWNKVREHIQNNSGKIDKIIVLDDGGSCLKLFPKDIAQSFPSVGVEQTTAGIMQLDSLNLAHAYIDVATSAAKSLEADMVANALINKLSSKLPELKSNTRCGIVGMGFIGTAVAKKLISLGYNVCLYDSDQTINANLKRENRFNTSNVEPKKNNIRQIRKTTSQISWKESLHELKNIKQVDNKVIWSENLNTLMQSSNYIFGCTGSDFTKCLDIENNIQGEKYFISCTSEDKEFLSVLKYIKKNSSKTNWHPLDDIHWRLLNKNFHLIKGGFPCNFDNSGTSVPANDIQLTRALILGALIQAVVSLPNYRRNALRNKVMLDPNIQKFVVLEWDKVRERNVFSSTKNIMKFQDNNWIMQNSGGIFYKLPFFSTYFKVNEDTVANTHAG